MPPENVVKLNAEGYIVRDSASLLIGYNVSNINWVTNMHMVLQLDELITNGFFF